MPASNQPDVSDLPGRSLSDLLDWRDALSNVLDEMINQNPKVREARDLLTKTNAVIFEKARPQAEAAYEVRGKTHGAVTLQRPDGIYIKADIPQSVDWDQDKLKEIASGLDWDAVQKVFKIKFTVPEGVYKNMVPGELLDKLTAARTTKTGDIKINVERA